MMSRGYAITIKIAADLVVSGPECRSSGLADMKDNDAVFGPSGSQRQLEGSKIFAARIYQRFGIPQTRCVVSDVNNAKQQSQRRWWVLCRRADGLAAGKRCCCPKPRQKKQSRRQLKCLAGYLTCKASSYIENMTEVEACFLRLSTGLIAVRSQCTGSQKRADQDQGPNTGGMEGDFTCTSHDDALRLDQES